MQEKRDVFHALVWKHFGEFGGERAEAFEALWFDRASVYSVQQGINDLSVCALRALRECMKIYHVEMTVLHQQLLMEDFDMCAELKGI